MYGLSIMKRYVVSALFGFLVLLAGVGSLFGDQDALPALDVEKIYSLDTNEDGAPEVWVFNGSIGKNSMAS